MGASKKLFMTEREYQERRQEIMDVPRTWKQLQCGTPILWKLEQLKKEYEQSK